MQGTGGTSVCRATGFVLMCLCEILQDISERECTKQTQSIAIYLSDEARQTTHTHTHLGQDTSWNVPNCGSLADVRCTHDPEIASEAPGQVCDAFCRAQKPPAHTAPVGQLAQVMVEPDVSEPLAR